MLGTSIFLLFPQCFLHVKNINHNLVTLNFLSANAFKLVKAKIMSYVKQFRTLLQQADWLAYWLWFPSQHHRFCIYIQSCLFLGGFLFRILSVTWSCKWQCPCKSYSAYLGQLGDQMPRLIPAPTVYVSLPETHDLQFFELLYFSKEKKITSNILLKIDYIYKYFVDSSHNMVFQFCWRFCWKNDNFTVVANGAVMFMIMWS